MEDCQTKKRPAGRNLPKVSVLMDTLQIEDNIRHNCRVKSYPDGSQSVMVAERAIFREPGWEPVGRKSLSQKWDIDFQPTPDVELSQYALERREDAERQRKADNLNRARRRAAVAVYDLALCTDFAYFVTLTLNKEMVDRYDEKEVIHKMSTWCDNHVRRDGLAYVLVPERHKDGAIHFHGFFNKALEVVDSGHKDSAGHTIFNLPAWSLGFTTAIALYGERRHACAYVTKYVTKQQEKIGGRWYYSGGALKRPEVTLSDVPFEDFEGLSEAWEFQIPALGVKCVKTENR